MVNDLTGTHHKPTLAFQTSKLLDDVSDNPTISINNPTGITFPPLFYTKLPNKLHMTRFKLFPKRRQFLQPKIIHRLSTLPSSPEQHPTLYIYSIVNTTQNGNLVTPTHNLVISTLVSLVTDSPIKVYSKTRYCFLYHRFKLQSLCFHIFYRTLHFYLQLSLNVSKILSQVEFSSSPDQTQRIIEITVHQSNNPTLNIRVLTQTPLKVNKATR